MLRRHQAPDESEVFFRVDNGPVGAVQEPVPAARGGQPGSQKGGIAGLLYAVYYNSFRATMGGAIGMKAFSAAVLGGLGDISISSICGLIIGIFENIGIALAGTGYRDMVAFLFLIAVLMLNPTGLGGKKKGLLPEKKKEAKNG